jgi:hypothetical protein
MATNYLDIMPNILQHFKEEVLKTDGRGEDLEALELWESDEPMVGNCTRPHMFDVYIDMEQANLAPNLVGANTIDKEVPVY